MKSLLTNLPEIFFISLGSAWAIENFYSEGSFNYIALLCVWLLLLQLIYKNKIIGIIYGNLLGLFSIYMLLAVYSEFSKFGYTNTDANILLGTGATVFSLGVFMAGKMLYKYFTTNKNYEDNALTISF